MGATPISLRCSRCKHGHRGDREDFGRNLRVIAHELRWTRARASHQHGAGMCHRALVECLDCGHVMRTTHPTAAFAVLPRWFEQ